LLILIKRYVTKTSFVYILWKTTI